MRGNSNDNTRIIYRALRGAALGMAAIMCLVVGIVLWRRLFVEGLALADLRYGEIVSLAILSGLALICFILALFIDREKNRTD